jgi:hypothetical protein
MSSTSAASCLYSSLFATPCCEPSCLKLSRASRRSCAESATVGFRLLTPGHDVIAARSVPASSVPFLVRILIIRTLAHESRDRGEARNVRPRNRCRDGCRRRVHRTIRGLTSHHSTGGGFALRLAPWWWSCLSCGGLSSSASTCPSAAPGGAARPGRSDSPPGLFSMGSSSARWRSVRLVESHRRAGRFRTRQSRSSPSSECRGSRFGPGRGLTESPHPHSRAGPLQDLLRPTSSRAARAGSVSSARQVWRCRRIGHGQPLVQ